MGSNDIEHWGRYRDAVAFAGDGFFAIGRDLRLIEVNEQLCGMLGYAPDELIGRSPLDVVSEGSRELMRVQMARIDSTVRRTSQYEARRKDGSTFPILVRAFTHRTPSGEVESSVGFVTDLSEIVQAQQALAASERELRAILDNMQDTYYRTNAEGVIVRASKSALQLLGYTAEEVLGLRLADFYVEPDGRERFLQALRASGGQIRNYESRLRHRDGRDVWVATNAQYYYDQSGKVAGVEGLARDNSEARRVREELRLAAQVFRSSAEAIVIADAQQRVISVNPAFVELTGFFQAVMGRPLSDFAALADGDLGAVLDESLAGRGQWSGEVWGRKADGRGFPSWLSVSAVRSDAGVVTHWVAIFSDITERKATHERMIFLAHHDPLTQLPNRVLLADRVAQAISRAARSRLSVALLFVDLDDFKLINDLHGHAAGDQALREIARRLAGSVRDTDTVARHGGDEFVIALTDVGDAALVDSVAAKIADCLAPPLAIDGCGDLRVACSIGVALYPRDGDDYEALVRHADAAMYAAKKAGRPG
jgi:diguanylate cyclase (GGDEF)-like protein/PAS domain S-box-containing protein